MNTISRYILVRSPYIWRSQVLWVMPLLIILCTLFNYWGGLETNFRDTKQLVRYVSAYATNSVAFHGSVTIILSVLSGFWIYLLFRFPLRNERKLTIIFFSIIAFLINATLLAGPLLYRHANIITLSHQAQWFGNAENDYATIQLVCKDKLSIQNKSALVNVINRWNPNARSFNSKLRKYEPLNSIVAYKKQKYKKWQKKYIKRFLSDNCGQNTVINNSILLNGIISYNTFKLIQNGYNHLYKMRHASLYSKKYNINSFSLLAPGALGSFFLWLFVLTLLAIIISTRAFGQAGRLKDCIQMKYQTIKASLIPEKFEMYLSKNRAVFWALGMHKLGSDTIIYVSLIGLISLFFYVLPIDLPRNGVAIIAFYCGIIYFAVNFLEKLSRQLNFHIDLSSSWGNMGKLLLSLAGQLPFALVMVCIFLIASGFYSRGGAISASDQHSIILGLATLIFIFIWMASVTLVTAMTNRLSCLFSAVLSAFIVIPLFIFIIVIMDRFLRFKFDEVLLLLAILAALPWLLVFRGVKSKAGLLAFTAFIPLIGFSVLTLLFWITEKMSLNNYLSDYIEGSRYNTELMILVFFLSLIIFFSMGFALKKLSLSDSKPRHS